MNKNILIIDDDPAILDALVYLLEYEGYTVKTAEKAEYAEHLNDVKGDLPQLIILDMLLSGKDGRTICQKLKTGKETKKIPIIMMSAHVSAEEHCKKAGADDFIAKPFEIDVLLDLVKKYI